MKTKIVYLSIAMFLTGCGGSDSGEPAVVQPPAATTGLFTLGLTDAPVDDAAKVVVEFDGVALKRSGADELEFTFDSRQVDLLSLQNGASELILEDITVEAGNYQWIRLMVNAERNTMDSYVELEDTNQISLFVPSGAQNGLKLNSGFTVLAGGSVDFTIDFDLRKSITDPRGQSDYFLKPSLRVIDNEVSGDVAGTVNETLVTAEGCSDASAVYVFDSEVTLDGVDDIDLAEDDQEDIGGPDPISSANVTLSDENIYEYKAAFLPPGDYILAFTCHASFDENDIDNTESETNMPDFGVSFTSVAEVTVNANETTTYNFE